MNKRDTLPLRITTKKGKLYDTKDKRRERIEEIYTHTRDTMTSPSAFHFITHIHDVELFEPVKRKGFIREFERAIVRQYKPASKRNPKSGRRQKAPNMVLVYSIEFKLTSQKEIDGDNDTYKHKFKKTKELLPFLHIHWHVIADCNDTLPENFTYHAMNAMNELSGLRATRYAKTIDGKKYKTLNTDFDDAVLRAYYLAKIEQNPPKGMIKGVLFNATKIDKLIT